MASSSHSPYLSLRNWWALLTEMQRDHIKLGIAALIVLLLAGGGYYWMRPAVHRWERNQALDQAKEFAAQKDYRNALLALQRAMDKNLNDVSGWTQVADFLSKLGSREVLVARKNLVALNPGDTSLRLGFVLDALRFGDVDSAQEVFAAVREGAREEVGFYRMAAAIAYVTGKTEQLEQSLEAIIQRNPADRNAALDLATLRLWGPDAARATAARQTLIELLKFPGVRVRAAVELLKHVARAGTRDEARAVVAIIHAHLLGRPAPQPTSSGTEALIDPPGWVPVVEAIKREALPSAQTAAIVARWLATIGQTREALVWLDGAPEIVHRSLLVSAASLELAVAINDVARLRPLLLEGAWGNARPEAVDLAFAARWQRQMGRGPNAQATWSDALTSSADSLPTLRALTRLAMGWGDTEGARSALWTIVDRFPTERWAWETLKLEYVRQQDTTRLWQLFDKWSRVQPDNRVVAQDWVMLSLLVGQATPAVHARAKQLFDAAPNDPLCILGYAVSLRAQKRKAEALAGLEKITGTDRDIPRIMLWRGILLAELERKNAARELLAAIDPTKFLPEEVQLLREARAISAAQPSVAPAKPTKVVAPAKR